MMNVSLDNLLEVIKAIRISDTGEWKTMDCKSVTFHCFEGVDKRQELSRLLDSLYKVANI